MVSYIYITLFILSFAFLLIHASTSDLELENVTSDEDAVEVIDPSSDDVEVEEYLDENVDDDQSILEATPEDDFALSGVQITDEEADGDVNEDMPLENESIMDMEAEGDATVDVEEGDATTLDVEEGDATTLDVEEGDATTLDVEEGDATTLDVEEGDATTLGMEEGDATHVVEDGDATVGMEEKDGATYSMEAEGGETVDAEEDADLVTNLHRAGSTDSLFGKILDKDIIFDSIKSYEPMFKQIILDPSKLKEEQMPPMEELDATPEDDFYLGKSPHFTDEELGLMKEPVEEAPTEETPTEEGPIEELDATPEDDFELGKPLKEEEEEESTEEEPTEEEPTEEVPTEEEPTEEESIEELDATPEDDFKLGMPIEGEEEEEVVEEVPVEEVPVEEVPVEEEPTEEEPTEEEPIEELDATPEDDFELGKPLKEEEEESTEEEPTEEEPTEEVPTEEETTEEEPTEELDATPEDDFKLGKPIEGEEEEVVEEEPVEEIVEEGVPTEEEPTEEEPTEEEPTEEEPIEELDATPEDDFKLGKPIEGEEKVVEEVVEPSKFVKPSIMILNDEQLFAAILDDNLKYSNVKAFEPLFKYILKDPDAKPLPKESPKEEPVYRQEELDATPEDDFKLGELVEEVPVEEVPVEEVPVEEVPVEEEQVEEELVEEEQVEEEQVEEEQVEEEQVEEEQVEEEPAEEEPVEEELVEKVPQLKLVIPSEEEIMIKLGESAIHEKLPSAMIPVFDVEKIDIPKRFTEAEEFLYYAVKTKKYAQEDLLSRFWYTPEWKEFVDKLEKEWSLLEDSMNQKVAKFMKIRNDEWDGWMKKIEMKWSISSGKIAKLRAVTDSQNPSQWSDQSWNNWYKNELETRIDSNVDKWLNDTHSSVFQMVAKDIKNFEDKKIKEWMMYHWKNNEAGVAPEKIKFMTASRFVILARTKRWYNKDPKINRQRRELMKLFLYKENYYLIEGWNKWKQWKKAKSSMINSIYETLSAKRVPKEEWDTFIKQIIV